MDVKTHNQMDFRARIGRNIMGPIEKELHDNLDDLKEGNDPSFVKDAKEFFKVEYKSKKISGDSKTQECYSKEPKSHISGSVFATDNNGKSYTKLGYLDGDYPFSVAIDYTKDDKSKKDECDAVDHPSHYTSGDIECIDAIRSALGDEWFKGFCRGNAIKYLWRAGKKEGEPAEKDLEKAKWYIKKEISVWEKNK
jgi:hypothetical protein